MEHTEYFKVIHLSPYWIGVPHASEHPEKGAEALSKALQRSSEVSPTTLGGRNAVFFEEIPPWGRIVVKQYRRGGLLRGVLRSRYFRAGPTRGERECSFLIHAKKLGINVPEPIGFARRGGLFYQAWLFTSEVANAKSIAELSLTDDVRLPMVMDLVIDQLERLIEAEIFHVDLHPGNVLFDSEGKVVLIDFDKATTFRGGKNKLRDKYLCRWRRAVIKHGLPESLNEYMANGLRKIFE